MPSPPLIGVRKKKPQYWFESHRKKSLKIFKLDLALWKKPRSLTGHCLIEVLRVCLILIVTSFATCVIVEAKNSIILIRTILSKELQWVLNDFQWVIFSVFQEFFDYVVSSSWSFFLGANQACNSCLSSPVAPFDMSTSFWASASLTTLRRRRRHASAAISWSKK